MVLPHAFDKFALAPWATKCVFVGYPFAIKGYKVIDLVTHKEFISRDGLL